MRTLTMRETGKGQSHWRRKPSNSDLAKVRGMVRDAVEANGLDCSVKVWIDRKGNYCDSLGYYPVAAVIRFRNPVEKIRTATGTLIRGLTQIRVNFYRKATILSIRKYGKRQEEEKRLFATLPVEDAKAAIESLPWDGDTFEFNGSTDGKEREYRRRYFSPYEGRGHFDYANTWDNLAKPFGEYIRNIARQTGYEQVEE